jgi:hypothetical protein
VIPSDPIMRWENEGGAVLLRPTGMSAPTRASKARRLQKSRPDQPAEGRQVLGDGGARDDQASQPGIASALGQREILLFELLA